MNGRAIATLWWREVVRFLRQPSRIAGAVAPPLVFWLLIGLGFSGSFRLPGAPPELTFLEYFLPGIVVLVVLFSSIFSSISLLEDRRHGFLQGVLVSPVSMLDLVLGKVLGGATLALLQALPFLLLSPLAGMGDGPIGVLSSWLAALGVLALVALAMTALGFTFAWRVESVQGFHAVMNLLLMPLWLLSGAFFPLSGAPAWLEAVMRANPLTYAVAALRHALHAPGSAAVADLPSVLAAVAVTGAAALLGLAAGTVTARSGRVA